VPGLAASPRITPRFGLTEAAGLAEAHADNLAVFRAVFQGVSQRLFLALCFANNQRQDRSARRPPPRYPTGILLSSRRIRPSGPYDQMRAAGHDREGHDPLLSSEPGSCPESPDFSVPSVFPVVLRPQACLDASGLSDSIWLLVNVGYDRYRQRDALKEAW